MDTYADFDSLKRKEKEGEDYLILFRKTEAPLAVMAPHGGGIEPGTVDIADAVAGEEHSFYAFKGIKPTGNRVLHLASNRFDEPRGRAIARNARIVLSIHGCKGAEETVFVGGRNEPLIDRIRNRLNAAGFHAVIPRTPGLQGQDPENLCNQCRSGQGVQLELSRGLRDALFPGLSRRSRRNKTPLFDRFITALRTALGSERPGQV